MRIVSDHEIKELERALEAAKCGYEIKFTIDAGTVKRSEERLHRSVGHLCWFCGGPFKARHGFTVIGLDSTPPQNVSAHTQCYVDGTGGGEWMQKLS